MLKELRATLKPGGVLFSSNPRGDNQEGWNGPRYGSYHDLQSWQGLLSEAGFVELEHYFRPAGLPLEQQPWLASVCVRGEAIGFMSLGLTPSRASLAPPGFYGRSQNLWERGLPAMSAKRSPYCAASCFGSRILYQATYSAGKNSSVSSVAMIIPPIIA